MASASAKDKGKLASAKAAACAWMDAHNGVTCAAIAVGVFVALVGLFLFCAFSDFGGAADFIYNQF